MGPLLCGRLFAFDIYSTGQMVHENQTGTAFAYGFIESGKPDHANHAGADELKICLHASSSAGPSEVLQREIA